MAPPKESNVDLITAVDDLDAPELFGYKVFDPKISIYHKAKGRELTRPCSGSERTKHVKSLEQPRNLP